MALVWPRALRIDSPRVRSLPLSREGVRIRMDMLDREVLQLVGLSNAKLAVGTAGQLALSRHFFAQLLFVVDDGSELCTTSSRLLPRPARRKAMSCENEQENVDRKVFYGFKRRLSRFKNTKLLKELFLRAILCTAIDILEYVFN